MSARAGLSGALRLAAALALLAGSGACAGSDAPETPGAPDCDLTTNFLASPDGQCDAPADICRPRPEVCTMDYRPVCGCDGKTYGNACGAAGAGVSVDYEGKCG